MVLQILCKYVDNFVNTINVPTENTRSEKICTLDRVDAEIRRAANECVEYNADRDKLKVKYARVPSGAETCQFCIMLASRGAVYSDVYKERDNEVSNANLDKPKQTQLVHIEGANQNKNAENQKEESQAVLRLA